MIALAITSLAVCLIIRLLDIRSKVLQALLAGPANDLINVYSKELFIKNYIGIDIDMVAFEEYKLRSEI